MASSESHPALPIDLYMLLLF